MKKTPVEIINADSATLDMVDGTVFFMFKPFGEKTLLKVIDNIKSSLVTTPRNIRVVCYGESELNKEFDKCEWLTYVGQIGGNLNMWSSKKV